jgi:hypothetical protein
MNSNSFIIIIIIKILILLTKRLSEPYTDCLDDLTKNTNKKTNIMKYMFDVLNMTHYSYKVCESVVYQQFLNNTCNCLDSNMQYLDWKQYLQSAKMFGFDVKYLNKTLLLNKVCHSSSQIDCMNAFNSNFSAQPEHYIADSCPTG